MKLTKLKKVNFLIAACVTLLFSCNQDEENSYIIVNPSDYQIIINNGNVETFSISGSSTIGFTRLKAIYKPEGDYSTTILDTSISGENIDFDFEFKAPHYVIDTTLASLSFQATLKNGEKVKAAKRLLIASEYLLQETAGHVMYSASSGEASAYNLKTGLPLYFSLTDSINIHIADTSSLSDNGNDLSRRWISNTGLRFVRFNDFDYASATMQMLQSSFESGLPREYLNDISEGDVILVAFDFTQEPTSYAAIYVSQVIDNEGVINDRYIFSLKK